MNEWLRRQFEINLKDMPTADIANHILDYRDDNEIINREVIDLCLMFTALDTERIFELSKRQRIYQLPEPQLIELYIFCMETIAYSHYEDEPYKFLNRMLDRVKSYAENTRNN